jgi:hypothetical protein
MEPLYDGEFDFIWSDDLAPVFASITKYNLELRKFLKIGPGGGNPNFVLRGTKQQLVAWIRDFYDPTLHSWDWYRIKNKEEITDDVICEAYLILVEKK